MAAAILLLWLDRDDFELVLIEKNAQLGKKVRISWGGRCNVTTGIEDKQTVLSKYTRGSSILKFWMGKYGPKKTREWFENNGVELKCEEDKRVFPVSDDSSDVMRVFEKIFESKPQAKILYQTSVLDIHSTPDSFELFLSNESTLEVDYLVITTGGNAYRKTGSTGDGYRFWEVLWHSITPLWPSLSSFLTNEEWMHELSGTVLERAQFRNGLQSVPYNTSWAVLFTHFWISGPGVFALSSEVAYETISRTSPLGLSLLPLAGWGYDAWEKYLQKEFQLNGARMVKTILKELLPSRFLDALGKQFQLEALLGTKGSIISKPDRQRISRLLWEGIPFTCLERRAGDEFVTAGWISTEEVDKETFESKIRKKLFFAGEILNIDWLTGGFNLQCAWTTGRLVGDELVKQLNNKKEIWIL